ncbi:hypothetical protein Desku_0913 [Desulfofundulus kuznetsovii DSM 6115]|uniref:Uncharacterized protein n=1 Tax=Desulfofundulus kuznetsovii (strain DSM 6115 / VKM B-1805 / 17) TaxID=760568 RepID=A0AAU8PFF9_DESK7|nr:hypothetical protein Desku_0913 [Desulfofundulus kuznetsovii DSM 6115]
MQQLTIFDILPDDTGQSSGGKRRKRRPLKEEYDECVAALKERFERHAEILAKGTTDPFYPDGVNANLVRNHILYYRKRLEEICSQSFLALPEIYFRPVPEPVDESYMAPGSRAAKLYKNFR